MNSQPAFYRWSAVVLLFLIAYTPTIAQEQEAPPQTSAEIGQGTAGTPHQVVLGDLPPIAPAPPGTIRSAPPPKSGVSEDEYRALKERAYELRGHIPLEVIIYTADRSMVVAHAYPYEDGTYRFELPAGTYVVDIHHKIGMGSSKDLPHQVFIKDGETVRFDFRFDIGIR